MLTQGFTIPETFPPDIAYFRRMRSAVNNWPVPSLIMREDRILSCRDIKADTKTSKSHVPEGLLHYRTNPWKLSSALIFQGKYIPKLWSHAVHDSINCSGESILKLGES